MNRKLFALIVNGALMSATGVANNVYAAPAVNTNLETLQTADEAGNPSSITSTILPINFQLVNPDPQPDTYTLTAKDLMGWSLGLPSSIDVPGGGSVELKLEVTLPPSGDAANVVTVTATSRSDPSAVVTAQIPLTITLKFDPCSYIDPCPTDRFPRIRIPPRIQIPPLVCDPSVCDPPPYDSSKFNIPTLNWKAEDIAALLPEKVIDLTSAHIAAIPPRAINGFNSKHIANLSLEAVSGFTKEQVPHFTMEAVTGFTAYQLTNLKPETKVAFSPEQRLKMVKFIFPPYADPAPEDIQWTWKGGINVEEFLHKFFPPQPGDPATLDLVKMINLVEEMGKDTSLSNDPKLSAVEIETQLHEVNAALIRLDALKQTLSAQLIEETSKSAVPLTK